MKPTLKDVTIGDAYKAYIEKGICCTMRNGQIECEVECEDYSEN